jgi:DNA-binding SARP family transcriptional activator
VWEEELWEVVLRPDRQYFEMLDPDDIDFPNSHYSRRFALIGDSMCIGRRSARRGIAPEINLSGPLEDDAASHRHALLMRQPDGSWALIDQESTNGTYLNYAPDPIPPNLPVPLQAGDRVHVGAWTTLTVERAEPVPSPSQEISVPSRDTRGVGRSRPQLEIRLLGPVQVAVAGRPVGLGSRQIRQVLSVLALRIGSAVAVGELQEAVWVEQVPATANKALQNHVHALREELGAEAVETTPHGYRLVGAKYQVDVFRFEKRAERGRQLLNSDHPGAAVAELARALELWRGDPLADLVDHPSWAGEASRLVERRAAAVEDLFEGRLRLGDHRGAIPDLKAAVAAEPLRPRRRGQLMLALFRDDHQREALAEFERYRKVLVEEAGLDPSPEIDALHAKIAMERPELRWTPPDGPPPDL